MTCDDSLEGRIDLLELRKAKAEDDPVEPGISLEDLWKKLDIEDKT